MTSPLRAFVAAFDDGERGAALVAIFQLGLHAGLAGIGFGAQAGGAQFGGQLEAFGGLGAVEHQHDDERRDRRDRGAARAAAPKAAG